jgi:hypothetical protein
MSDETEFVTLIVPQGAELAPISHGDVAYEAYRAAGHPAAPTSAPRGYEIWYVDVPSSIAEHFCARGGFARLKK